MRACAMPLWNAKRDHEMTAIPGLLHGALMNIVVWRFLVTTRLVEIFGRELMKLIGVGTFFHEHNKAADTLANWLMDKW